MQKKRKGPQKPAEAPETAPETANVPEAPETAPEPVGFEPESEEARNERHDRCRAAGGKPVVGSDGRTYYVCDPGAYGLDKGPMHSDVVLAPYTLPEALGGTGSLPRGRRGGPLDYLGNAAFLAAQETALAFGSGRFPYAAYAERLGDPAYRPIGCPEGSIDGITGQFSGARDPKHLRHDCRKNKAVLYLRPSEEIPEGFGSDPGARAKTPGRAAAHTPDADAVYLSPEERAAFFEFLQERRKSEES